jgi:hypothetical protein
MVYLLNNGDNQMVKPSHPSHPPGPTARKRVKVPSSSGSRAKARMVRREAGRTKLLQPGLPGKVMITAEIV